MLPAFVLVYVLLLSAVLVLKRCVEHKRTQLAHIRRARSNWDVVRQDVLESRQVKVLGITWDDWITTGASIFDLPDRIKLQLRELLNKAQQTIITVAMICSVFFLKTCIAGFDCSQNINGRFYLDAEKQTECSMDVSNTDLAIHAGIKIHCGSLPDAELRI